jgi:glycosyltransferase involved in cell wall biosynthesis
VRIVHVSDCYPPRTGGIESQVRDLATHQAGAGDAVHVLTATADAGGRRRSTRTDPGGVRVHRMASGVTLGLPVHPLGGRLVHRALVRLDPDVVHVHAGVVSPFAHDGARAARELGMPLVISWHCMLTGVEPWVRLGARLTGWTDARVALTAVSRVAADRVAAALARDDVTVVTNGLDLAPWRAAAGRRTPRGDGPLRVVATQRLAPRKRSVPLVRAFAAAVRRLGPDPQGRPRATLTVVGSGPDAAAVRREVDRLGLGEEVQLMGRVPREELPEVYARHDVFVSAVELEAFGIAALEARAAGLAVAGRAGTGLAEFVRDGVDGVLASDDAGLADAVVLLAADPAFLRQVLDHNRAVAPAADFTDVLAAARREYARARRLVGRPPLG